MRPRWWWLGALLFAWPLSAPRLDRADAIGYLAPALSLASDGDLLYHDEYAELGLNARYFRPTSAGLPGNHWSPGLGLLLLPVYALASALDSSDAALSAYRVASLSAFSACLGLLLLCSLSGACRLLEPRGPPARWAVRRELWVPVAVYLGTPLVYYAHVAAYRPHLAEAALASLLFWLTLAWLWRGERLLHGQPLEPGGAQVTWRWSVLGVLVGMLFLVRSQAALVALPTLALLVRQSLRTARAKLPVARPERLARSAAGWLAFVIAALPFALVSRQLQGILYPDGASAGLVQALTQVEVDLWASLLHPHHGLLSWSPLIALSLAGLLLASRRLGLLGAAMLAALALEAYLNATSFDQAVDRYHYTRHWAGGASFGGRRYACCLPFFAVGLQQLLVLASRGLPRAGSGWSSKVAWASVALGVALVGSVAFEVSLAFAARAFPHRVLETSMTWPGLWSAALEPLRSPSVVLRSLRDGAPGGPVALAGLLTALAVVGLLGLALALVARLRARARSLTALGLALVASVAGVVAAGWLDQRTWAHAERDRPRLALWIADSARRAPVIERDIRSGNAELRTLSGRLEQALGRYESSFELGLSRRAVVGYLTTLARARGRDEALAALARLRSRHPGHPALADGQRPAAASPAD